MAVDPTFCERCYPAFGTDLTALEHAEGCQRLKEPRTPPAYGTVALSKDETGWAHYLRCDQDGMLYSHIGQVQWDELITRLDRIEKALVGEPMPTFDELLDLKRRLDAEQAGESE